MKGFRACPTIEQQASYLKHFFLFRKQAVLEVGGLDETIGSAPGIDDFDLIWTLLENGASVAIVEKQLYHYRDHDGERLTLQDKGQLVENLRKILRKHGVWDADAAEIISRHAPWYGRPMYQVIEERLHATPSQPRATPAHASAGNGGLDLSLDAVMSYALPSAARLLRDGWRRRRRVPRRSVRPRRFVPQHRKDRQHDARCEGSSRESRLRFGCLAISRPPSRNAYLAFSGAWIC